jgi:quercetin dioxygenase-like cupin family protein
LEPRRHDCVYVISTSKTVMASPERTIVNSKTGQSFRFIQTSRTTNGELLEIESSWAPNSKEPPAHYHPRQSETFTVVQGELTVKIGTQVRVLRKGDSIHIPPRQVHSMWNNSSRLAVANWQTRPALNSEELFETIVGLANENKTDAEGKPPLLQLALTINEFSNVFRLVSPPYFIQKILFSILTPFAYLSGKRAVYKRYLNH